MIVTQRKRIIHDQEGKICKVDILQSVRRTDAPGTLIVDPQEKNIKGIIESTKQNPRQSLKNIRWLAFCILLFAIYLLCSLKQQEKMEQPIQGIVDLAAFSKKQFTLSELLKLSQIDGKWNKQTQSRFLSNSKCVVEPFGYISCRFNFSEITTNDTLL